MWVSLRVRFWIYCWTGHFTCCRGPTSYFLEASYELVWFLFIACGHGIGCNEVFGGLGIVTIASCISFFWFSASSSSECPPEFWARFSSRFRPIVCSDYCCPQKVPCFWLGFALPGFSAGFLPGFVLYVQIFDRIVARICSRTFLIEVSCLEVSPDFVPDFCQIFWHGFFRCVFCCKSVQNPAWNKHCGLMWLMAGGRINNSAQNYVN